MRTRADKIARFFETFSQADVAALDAWYTPDATFRDPFNDVAGLAAIQSVYRHMFEQVESPRFTVLDTMAGDTQCWLVWDMAYGPPGKRDKIHGASLLRLAPDGRIAEHRDYWDAAGEVYEKVPVLGGVLRMVRRKLAAPRV